jgi:hypothetical protein
VPLTLVYDDSTDGSRFFDDSSDQGRNNRFNFPGLKKIEKGCLHSIDASKLAVSNSRAPQGAPQNAPEITDLTGLIEVDVEKGPAASQGKGDLWVFLLMGLQKPLEGQIGHDIAVIAEDSPILVQKVFNIFESSRRVQKDRLIAKGDRNSSPLSVRKFLQVDFRAMMGVDDKAIYAHGQEMIHRIGDHGSSSELQKRLRQLIGQRAKPQAESRAQDESGLESRQGDI